MVSEQGACLIEMRQSRRSFAKISAVIFALGVTAYITAYISHWLMLGPEAYCKTSSIAESWAPDHAYKATVLKKDCNLSESVFYSIRVDSFSPPERIAWFTVRELENDTRPEPPNLTWSTARQLKIMSTTKTLSGRLSEHVGDDLTIERVFSPLTPDAFPNYD
jgi:hypothetical protein